MAVQGGSLPRGSFGTAQPLLGRRLLYSRPACGLLPWAQWGSEGLQHGVWPLLKRRGRGPHSTAPSPGKHRAPFFSGLCRVHVRNSGLPRQVEGQPSQCRWSAGGASQQQVAVPLGAITSFVSFLRLLFSPVPFETPAFPPRPTLVSGLWLNCGKRVPR